MTSPTQRTLALLKKEGYICQVVERFNMFAHVRIDLFGFIDIVAIKPGVKGVFGIQCTSRQHVTDHIKKISEISTAKDWINAGNFIEVWGWSKKGKARKRKLWEVYKEEISLQDLT